MTKPKEKPPLPIVIEADAEGVGWVLIVCPFCGEDLSKVSHGRITLTPLGEIFETYHPIRCTECNHPLLPLPERSPIQKPGGFRA